MIRPIVILKEKFELDLEGGMISMLEGRLTGVTADVLATNLSWEHDDGCLGEPDIV